MSAQVWSCGGGIQSAAIAALIVQGRLPKPDISIIVDTEREKSTTWEYYEQVLRPALHKVLVPLIRVPKSEFATVDLYSGNGDLLIPAFTQSGKLPTFCSNEWKRRVIMRYVRSRGILKCQNWLGISLDEMRRVRTGPPAWFQARYPLIYDVPMRRNQCIEVVRQMGWPPAPRSACYMCPNQADEEWQAESEKDMAQADEFERRIQEKDSDVWLHRSRRPIRETTFRHPSNPTDDSGCQTGFCFT